MQILKGGRVLGLFSVTTKWEGSLEQEVEAHVPRIKDAANMALHSCESEMSASLLEHIKNDWYDAWGEPLVYKRRSDNDDYGQGLMDPDNITPNVNGLTLTFLFTPNAKHSAKNWSRDLSSDELIEVIQTNSGWKYEPTEDRRGRKIMPRPFWNNFVEEQRNGMLFGAFESGFGGRGYDLEREGGTKDLDFPPNESMLDGGFDAGAISDDEWLDSLGDW